MSGPLHDPGTVAQALDVAINNVHLIPRVVAATGRSLSETGCEQFALIAAHLEKIHGRGAQSVDVDVLCAELAESTRYEDRDAWKKVITGILGTGLDFHLDEYEDRLRRLRRRRQFAQFGDNAQNGHGDEALERDLKILASETQTSRLEPLECLDLAAPAPPAPPALVGDEAAQLLTAGELTGVVADSGAGKTKLLVGMALAIARGGEVLGFACQQQPVLFVSSDPDPDIHRTISRSWEGQGGTAEGLAALPLKVFSNSDFNLDEEAWFGRARATLQELGARERPATFILEALSTNVSDPKILIDQVLFREYARRRLRFLMGEFPWLSIIFSAHLRKPQQGGGNGLGDRS